MTDEVQDKYQRHLEAAEQLGRILESQATEFARLVASGTSTWAAQKLCDTEYAVRLEIAKANLDISRARLVECSCR